MSAGDEQQHRPVYAHTLPNAPCEDWEPLETHLAEVASRTGAFAAVFGAYEWGQIVGCCHDLGKASLDFQRYLFRTSDPDAGAQEGSAGRVDHSTFGARYVAESIGKHRGQMLAYCIAGHHAGLPDGTSDDESTQGGTLRKRLDGARYLIPEVNCPAVKLQEPRLNITAAANGLSGFQIAFFVRMIFSCLIDADRLATEEFCDPAKAQDRDCARPSVLELKGELDRFLEQKQSTSDETAVNRMRAKVLEDCRSSARLPPGFFSLNVPTGGGKTYSSLAFALDHASRFGLRQVVVAIPFTSIIEQTADAYRQALRSLAEHGLIEHHTNINPRHDTRSNQFGTENWDAPVVVTTNVQFFESLFASATSPCRKLHRLARSVIVLDEAQTIPVELLKPALEALKELVLNYGCSIVLCTATQPALERRSDFELESKKYATSSRPRSRCLAR
jgi:CRISPR-associated endonuclease/helicase Cas3